MIAAISWIALVWIVMRAFRGGPLDFLTALVVCRTEMIPVSLLLLGALVQFGTHFYEFTHDSQWVRWKEAKHEPEA